MYPRGHSATSGDSFDCHNMGLGAADRVVGVGHGRCKACESAQGGHHSAGNADIGEP